MKTYRELAARAGKGESCVLATVIDTEGSSPAEPSMKMLAGPHGRITGTVGGGRVEAEVERTAQRVLTSGVPETLAFTLDDDLADEGGLICGGTVRILVERVDPPAAWAAAAADAFVNGQRAALLARIGQRVERELLLDAEADRWIADELPRLEGDLFVEPIFRPRCILLGAGHVGRAVARVAREAGFVVTVVEDRAEQAARAEADQIITCADLVEGFGELETNTQDFVVVLTRSHGLDYACARAALASPARYVGMLASRKKAARLRAELEREEDGPDAARLESPVGLEIGAASAGEIAVSIVARMIQVKRTARESG